MENRSPNWLDTELYPFKSHHLSLSSGQMHYVDEGQGEIILFVHGTPTWSFLYRNFITKFAKDYRCIAVDHLGFGLSDKPENFAYRPQDHAENLSEFIQKLDLQNITLVVHDFGGPIGLGAALDQPKRIKQVVLFNTWLWETASNPAVKKIDKITRSWLGKFLYLHLNFSPKVLLKKGFADKKKLSKRVHQQYTRPFPTKASRQSLLRLAQSLHGSSAWYQEQWEKLDVLSEKPWLILWGTHDEFITTDYLKHWTDRLPQAKVKTWGCGHFVQEEHPNETITALKAFLVGEKVSAYNYR
ncbi:alpha/beta fold hydrolase [Tunicatimonas pelagia]|uniref:alpha/beta fold hydrolase n=1 Tax=Tunicatimonas pelagia TaxID=931531 RepID=UPI002665B3B6|nr:alpha/beta fold hydrolase [Tunicatimonas pelagia]WKN41554.1 alpha/beta fold hydrolase [Tunicatimonas pelagia]